MLKHIVEIIEDTRVMAKTYEDHAEITDLLEAIKYDMSTNDLTESHLDIVAFHLDQAALFCSQAIKSKFYK